MFLWTDILQKIQAFLIIIVAKFGHFFSVWNVKFWRQNVIFSFQMRVLWINLFLNWGPVNGRISMNRVLRVTHLRTRAPYPLSGECPPWGMKYASIFQQPFVTVMKKGTIDRLIDIDMSYMKKTINSLMYETKYEINMTFDHSHLIKWFISHDDWISCTLDCIGFYSLKQIALLWNRDNGLGLSLLSVKVHMIVKC